MSVQALTLAFAARGLAPSEKLVLLALANYADEAMRCWPSQDSLALATELSSRTVWGALKALEGRGLISRTSRTRSDGTRSTDTFTLCFDRQPVAKSAKPTRKICEVQSQPLPNPVAAVATLTTFEPSIEEPSEEANAIVRLPSRASAFALFWAAYPRKTGKGAAEKAFTIALGKIDGPDPPAVLMAALERVKPTWRDPNFIPHATTWLNQRRWEDEPDERPDFDPTPRSPDAGRQRADANFAGAALALNRRRGGQMGSFGIPAAGCEGGAGDLHEGRYSGAPRLLGRG